MDIWDKMIEDIDKPKPLGIPIHTDEEYGDMYTTTEIESALAWAEDKLWYHVYHMCRGRKKADEAVQILKKAFGGGG